MRFYTTYEWWNFCLRGVCYDTQHNSKEYEELERSGASITDLRPSATKTEMDPDMDNAEELHRFMHAVSHLEKFVRVLNWVNACWVCPRVEYVVNVDSVEVFKKRLDKFWSNQPVKFDWRASLTGTGDRSEFLVE